MAVLAVLAFAGCEKSSAPGNPAGSGSGAVASTRAWDFSAGEGELAGQVRVAGTVPPLPPVRTTPSVAKVCGEELPDGRLQLAADGALQNAIAFIADAPAEPTPAGTKVVVDQRGCRYLPPLVAARAGATLSVLNSDPLMHNVRAGGHAAPLFNVAMPVEGMTLNRPLPQGEAVVDLHCDVHPWMNAVVRTFRHGHFALTGPDGRFRLPHLSVGQHTLTVFHPLWPEQSVEVTVAPGRTTEQSVTFQADARRVENVIGR